MPEPTMYRFRDRLPRPDEGKQPANEIALTVKDGVANLYLYDVIDSWGGFWGTSAAEILEALSNLPDGTETINLHLNSPGGEVFEAITIKNLLADHPARVVAVVDGLAASAASFLAVSADETVMGDNSTLMIHDAHVIMRGNAADLRSAADDLDMVSDNIAAMYAAKAGGDAADWRAVMQAEKWYVADEAVSAGLADRVGTATSPEAKASAKDDTLQRQQVAALSVIRGAVAFADPPIEAETKEKTEQQAEMAPTATAASGAGRSADEPIAPIASKPAPKAAESEDAMPGMSIPDREARIVEIDARLNEINAAYPGDIPPEDVNAEWENLLDEKADHQSVIKDVEKRRQELAASAAKEAAGESERSVARRAPAAVVLPENIYDTAAIRANAGSLDKIKKGHYDNAMRAVERATMPSASAHGSSREDAQARVAALLEREFRDENEPASPLAARILNSGSPTYMNAFGKAFTAAARFNPNPLAGLSPQEVNALTLGTDTDGGYAVPFELDPTVILTSSGSQNPMRKLARVVEITGKKWEGLTTGGATATREGETDEAANSNPVFAQPTIDTSRVDVEVEFSVALQASWSQLSEELSMLISDAITQEEASSFILGAGTALTTGGTLPQGILTGLSATTTSYVVVGTTGSLTRADLYATVDALPPRFNTDQAAWIASRSFFTQTRGLETVGDTTPLSDTQMSNLVGAPKNVASYMPNFSTTANANLAIYGNINRAYTIVDRIGFNIELIPHMFGSNGRPNGKRGLWGYRYNGAKLIVPSAAVVLRMK